MYHFFLSKYFYSFLYSWFHISTKNNFLIIGPRGSGKTSLVYLWSGYINAFLLEVSFSRKAIYRFKEIFDFILFHINKLQTTKKFIIFFNNVDALGTEKIYYIIHRVLLKASNTCNYCLNSSTRISEQVYPTIVGCYSTSTFLMIEVNFFRSFSIVSIFDLDFKQKVLFFTNILGNLLISKKNLIKLVSDLCTKYYIADMIRISKTIIDISIKRLIFIFFTKVCTKKVSKLQVCVNEEDLKLATCFNKAFSNINMQNLYVPEFYSFTYIDKVTYKIKKKLTEPKEFIFIKYSKKKKFKNGSSILLIGPPGCGKTFIGKKIAIDFKLFYLYIKTPQILSKYVGEAEKYLNKVFLKANKNTPALLFFDEIDTIALSRNSDNEGNNKITQQLLLELDELNFKKNLFIIGATNLIEIIDLAILRKGRFNKKFLIPYPSGKNKLNIFRNQTSNKFLNNDFDLKVIVIEFFSIYKSGADIKDLLNQISNANTLIQDVYVGLNYRSKKFIIFKNNRSTIKVVDLIKTFI